MNEPFWAEALFYIFGFGAVAAAGVAYGYTCGTKVVRAERGILMYAELLPDGHTRPLGASYVTGPLRLSTYGKVVD